MWNREARRDSRLAYTFDDLTRQQALYLNNVTAASGLSHRSIAYDTQPVLLGCDSGNGNHNWLVQGRIDEAAIYKRALTAPEIAALYYAGVAGKSTVGPYFTALPSLLDAIINQPYRQTITSTRGTPPVSYTLSSGSLPAVLTFSSSGLLSGTPANAWWMQQDPDDILSALLVSEAVPPAFIGDFPGPQAPAQSIPPDPVFELRDCRYGSGVTRRPHPRNSPGVA